MVDRHSSLVEDLPALRKVPIIGILRGCRPSLAVAFAAATAEAGLTVLEVTFDSEDPGRQIRAIGAQVPELTLGAGTVMSPDQVAVAAAAGASFVISPLFLPGVLDAAGSEGIPYVPGAATPTEVWRAHWEGAAAVKVFPARQLGGPSYITALHVPLAGVALIPTGGISVTEIPAYLKAGAGAVGLGSELFPRVSLEQGDVEGVRSRAAAALATVK